MPRPVFESPLAPIAGYPADNCACRQDAPSLPSIPGQLDRLRTLSKQLNGSVDQITRVVNGVETFLSRDCGVGVSTDVLIDEFGPPHNRIERRLVYGRLGGRQFRIWVTVTASGGSDTGYDDAVRGTFGFNGCPRELRLAAYEKLPELLDALAERLEEQMEDLKATSESIAEIVG